jgi:hypothetical protein
MDIKLFTDLIDTSAKVAGSLKTIVNLPKAERETICRTLDQTYRLIDTTLNMVIIRLGDILLHASDDYFLREAAQLNDRDEWMLTGGTFDHAIICRLTHLAEGSTP